MEAVIIYVIGIAVITSVFITAVKFETYWNGGTITNEKQTIPTIVFKRKDWIFVLQKAKNCKMEPLQYIREMSLKGVMKFNDDNPKTEVPLRGESKMKDIYKNKPNKYLYNCIVEGIVGKESYREENRVPPVIKPNEALPSFEELTVEYPPKLVKRIFKKLIRKGYVVERNGKLIVIDTKIANKIKKQEYENYENSTFILIVIIIMLAVAFLVALFVNPIC
jgi:DNA-binding transcriptional regulator YhcF (GntR family)